MRLSEVGRRRVAARDEGSIAVMGALLIPVVLAVIALAMSSLIWGASESEVQRAADQAAVEGAGSALLTDFPYASLSPYDALAPTLAQYGIDPTKATVPACNTLGNPVSAGTAVLTTALQTITTTIPNPIPGLPPITTTTITGGLASATQTAINTALATLPTDLQAALGSLPNGCSALTGTTNPIPPDIVASSQREACLTASENLVDDRAPYAIRFFDGSSDKTPTCKNLVINGNGRVRVYEATKSPLLGLNPATVSVNPGTSACTTTPDGQQVCAAPDTTQLSVPSGITSVQQLLAQKLGVRLDSVLPNSLCPQVTVHVDQPVKGMIGGVSVPNGRATAKRVLKNVVVVPVYNGQHLASAAADVALSTGATASTPAGLASVYTTVSGGVSSTVSTPALNLNTVVLDRARTLMLDALDDVDQAINTTLANANSAVQSLPGVSTSIDTTLDINGQTTTLGSNPSASTQLNQLDLLKCIRQTASELYNSPETGPDINSVTGIDNNHPVRDVLAAAAKSREPVTIVQVGVKPCRTLSAVAASIVGTLTCMEAALGSGAASLLNTVTGLYDIPFLDITPTVVRDVGNGNYEAVPIHASQANGAFRAILVRNLDDPRYIP